jgi:hypothetical protein
MGLFHCCTATPSSFVYVPVPVDVANRIHRLGILEVPDDHLLATRPQHCEIRPPPSDYHITLAAGLGSAHPLLVEEGCGRLHGDNAAGSRCGGVGRISPVTLPSGRSSLRVELETRLSTFNDVGKREVVKVAVVPSNDILALREMLVPTTHMPNNSSGSDGSMPKRTAWKFSPHITIAFARWV